MKSRVLILGAGFGGLELCTALSERFGKDADVTMIDKADAFAFGFSKLDVLFGKSTLDAIKLPYAEVVKPGVRLLRETIAKIDPEHRRVTTNAGTHEADVLVIALGADYDYDATPGLAQAGEFYSLSGAEKMAARLPSFAKGRVLIAVGGAPYKCPPAPSECALLLHDYLMKRGVRAACEITLASPLGSPVPPSPDTSRALLAAFAERNISFVPDVEVKRVDGAAGVARFDDGSERSFDLFLGVPKQHAPDVVEAAGLTVDGFIPVNTATLETKVAGVYAIGDCATQGTPKAGVFAEGAAKALAKRLIAKFEGRDAPDRHSGFGSCYLEFGGGRIGRVDVDFLSGPEPLGQYWPPSAELRADKDAFGTTRRARWFART
jgi:sulfide:quinone oxidoreductase